MFNNFLSNGGLNWVDLVVFGVLLIYAIEGYATGFLSSLLDLFSFVISFVIGLKTYIFAGKGIQSLFSISNGFANAIGFLIAASFSEIIIGYISRRIIYNLYFSRIKLQGNLLRVLDKIFGAGVGIISGLVLLSFIFSIVAALPVSLFLKHSVTTSKIGNFLIAGSQGFEKDLNNVFGGAVNDTLNFLTVEPKSEESVNLNFKTSDVAIDSGAENDMYQSVNSERTSRGLKKLALDKRLTDVGRKHCIDMFKRGYFSHYTPEGLSPFDRMAQADITFTYAGENLALAPNVPTAMQGLMKSPGHRANILSANFGTIGIGAIDGGVYGQMYCQEFTD